MALTKAKIREILSAAGVDAEHMKDATDKIIDGHLASVDALREEIAKYKPEAEKAGSIQKELDALKKFDGAGWKEKAESWEQKYNDLVQENTAKEEKAAKEAAVRSYYESKGITGKALEIAMRGSGTEIAALALENGKIKDTAALDTLVSGDFSGLVGQTHTEGANTATPPAASGSGYASAKEIMSIKDRQERRAAIAANMQLFEKGN